MNGTTLADEDAPAPRPTRAEQETLAAKVRASLDAQVGQTIGTMIRGILVSAPGVNPRELLNSIARVTGNVCASSISGEFAALLAFRKAMKDAFDEGVNKAPVLQPPANQPSGSAPAGR